MTVNRDFYNSVKLSRAISAQSVADNTAQVSQIIDTRDFDTLTFLIDIGVLADAAATFVVLVEDGDDSGLSDNAAVADADLLGTEALVNFDQADDNTVGKIGYIGSKRYVRMTITPADNGTAAIFGVTAVQTLAKSWPVA